MPTRRIPSHHGKDERSSCLPRFERDLCGRLVTPEGVFVVRMVPSRWGASEYSWRILSQPAGWTAQTTGPRPGYSLDEADWGWGGSYNNYHQALNYLEDAIYAAQQSA